jgi:uncharacterized protein (DUF2062 family)
MAVKRRSLSRTLRYYYHRVFPRHERSLPVAISVAIGVWIGVFPTIGVAILLTALVAQIARVPKAPGILASFIAIPPTLFFFFYPLGYFGVGLPLLDPPQLDFEFLAEIEKLNMANAGEIAGRLWRDAREHLIAFVVGMAIVATVTAAISFVVAYLVMEQKRRRREARRRMRRIEREAASQQDATSLPKSASSA